MSIFSRKPKPPAEDEPKEYREQLRDKVAMAIRKKMPKTLESSDRYDSGQTALKMAEAALATIEAEFSDTDCWEVLVDVECSTNNLGNRVLVPIVPTDAMKDALLKCYYGYRAQPNSLEFYRKFINDKGHDCLWFVLNKAWPALLEARPPAGPPPKKDPT